MKKISKVWLVLLSALLLVMSVGCQDVRAQFDKFIQAEFVNTMESDYMTAHIYLEHPENFGVDMSKTGINLGIRPDMEAKKEYYRTVKERYQEFKTFNRKQLTDDQKDTYDIYDFVTSLELQLNEEKFDYYQPLFQSMSGVHMQLPTILSDWVIRNEQDVQDLIDLVKDIRPYVASALEYTKKQEELGLLMLDLQSVIDYCDSIVQSGENSAVLSSMNQSIDALSLPAEKSEAYKRQLKAAFSDSLLPAYEEIRNAMQIFLNGNNNEEGLARFPEGKEYFALLLQNNCGTNKSVEEIRTMMKERLNGHLSNLFRVMMVNPDFAEMLTGAQQPKTGFTSYTGMLDGIQQKMFQDFPQVSQLEYDIMDIHEEITSEASPRILIFRRWTEQRENSFGSILWEWTYHLSSHMVQLLTRDSRVICIRLPICMKIWILLTAKRLMDYWPIQRAMRSMPNMRLRDIWKIWIRICLKQSENRSWP